MNLCFLLGSSAVVGCTSPTLDTRSLATPSPSVFLSTPETTTQARPSAPSQAAENVTLEQAFAIMKRNCRVCHHLGSLKQVIQQVESSDFQELEKGLTKVRLLPQLKKLYELTEEGSSFDLAQKEELLKYSGGNHEPFALALENNAMPPFWADSLMKAIPHTEYLPLTAEQRTQLRLFFSSH